MRSIMPLNITPERFAAITKIISRKVEALVAEITATDWNLQPQFANVDDFLKFADTFVERLSNPLRRSPKRR
jgi:hypothetical protein